MLTDNKIITRLLYQRCVPWLRCPPGHRAAGRRGHTAPPQSAANAWRASTPAARRAHPHNSLHHAVAVEGARGLQPAPSFLQLKWSRVVSLPCWGKQAAASAECSGKATSSNSRLPRLASRSQQQSARIKQADAAHAAVTESLPAIRWPPTRTGAAGTAGGRWPWRLPARIKSAYHPKFSVANSGIASPAARRPWRAAGAAGTGSGRPPSWPPARA